MGGPYFAVRKPPRCVFGAQHRQSCTFMVFDKCLAGTLMLGGRSLGEGGPDDSAEEVIYDRDGRDGRGVETVGRGDVEFER